MNLEISDIYRPPLTWMVSSGFFPTMEKAVEGALNQSLVYIDAMDHYRRLN